MEKWLRFRDRNTPLHVLTEQFPDVPARIWILLFPTRNQNPNENLAIPRVWSDSKKKKPKNQSTTLTLFYHRAARALRSPQARGHLNDFAGLHNSRGRRQQCNLREKSRDKK
jgi:hypothetical protein